MPLVEKTPLETNALRSNLKRCFSLFFVVAFVDSKKLLARKNIVISWKSCSNDAPSFGAMSLKLISRSFHSKHCRHHLSCVLLNEIDHEQQHNQIAVNITGGSKLSKYSDLVFSNRASATDIERASTHLNIFFCRTISTFSAHNNPILNE